MVHKSHVRNEHVEAYLEGKFEEIPVALLEEVRERAEAREKSTPAPATKADPLDDDVPSLDGGEDEPKERPKKP